MSIKASDLVAKVRQALAEGWGYIWGTRGQVWTQAQQDRATRDMTVRYGQKWVGKRVADCSGLIKWAFRELGGDIYHGSNTMWNSYTDKAKRGTVSSEMRIFPGTAVFQVNDGKRTHVGIYVGQGKYGVETVIEAQGTRTGVVESKLSSWDEWGELLVKIGGEMVKVDYDLPANLVESAPRTMRKGDSGADVKALQEALIRAGYDLGSYGADGKYGSETLSAVRAFQYDHGLKADGIAGPLTLNALRQTEDDEPNDDEDKPAEAPDGPKEPDEDSSETPPLTVEERLTRLEQAVFGREGGESDG